MYVYKVENKDGVVLRGFEFKLTKALDICNCLATDAINSDAGFFRADVVGLFNGFKQTIEVNNANVSQD